MFRSYINIYMYIFIYIIQTIGLPVDLIHRIYRCLFVYSTGFYELIQEILNHIEYKSDIIANIWKVFAILLEFCSRNEF